MCNVVAIVVVLLTCTLYKHVIHCVMQADLGVTPCLTPFGSVGTYIK